MTTFDVVIIGSGPAGSTAAIALHDSGLSVALVDKNEFPRDKICGDALSPDVVSQLQKLPLDTASVFQNFEEKIWCNAVRFISPNYQYADLRLNSKDLTGYVSQRIAFDHFMFAQAEKSNTVTAYTGSVVKGLKRNKSGIEVILENEEILRASMVLGADGAHSIVVREFAKEPINKNHHCAGLRQYYENVTGFSDDNAVELHFYDKLLPGYFWIFPLPGNKANVGLGMLSSFVSKRKPNLKRLLKEIIETHPNVKERFKNATPLEDVKGFGLPLGSKKRRISGNRYLLLGDAAALINPLSGEGIANAIRSGRVAAEHIQRAFNEKRFDAEFNLAYDNEIYKRMWGELRLNYWIQIAMRNRRMCNFIVKYAIGNKFVQDLVLSGFNANHLKPKFLRSN